MTLSTVACFIYCTRIGCDNGLGKSGVSKRGIALFVLTLFLGTQAVAQNANDYMRIFGGFVQQGMVQVAQFE
jgi:hypothetical protein